jgi:hypothetical protein
LLFLLINFCASLLQVRAAVFAIDNTLAKLHSVFVARRSEMFANMRGEGSLLESFAAASQWWPNRKYFFALHPAYGLRSFTSV